MNKSPITIHSYIGSLKGFIKKIFEQLECQKVKLGVMYLEYT